MTIIKTCVHKKVGAGVASRNVALRKVSRHVQHIVPISTQETLSGAIAPASSGGVLRSLRKHTRLCGATAHLSSGSVLRSLRKTIIICPLFKLHESEEALSGATVPASKVRMCNVCSVKTNKVLIYYRIVFIRLFSRTDLLPNSIRLLNNTIEARTDK